MSLRPIDAADGDPKRDALILLRESSVAEHQMYGRRLQLLLLLAHEDQNPANDGKNG